MCNFEPHTRFKHMIRCVDCKYTYTLRHTTDGGRSYPVYWESHLKFEKIITCPRCRNPVQFTDERIAATIAEYYL